MEELSLSGELRTEFGSRVSATMRGEGRLPANLYGLGKPNVHFSLDRSEFTRFLDAGHRMVTLSVGGAVEHGVVKEVQYDGLGSSIVHVDFTRISADVEIEVEVALELIGVPKGVASGGSLNFTHKEVLVHGLPQHIPESIVLNVEALEQGESIRIKNLPPVANCRYVEDEETVLVAVSAPRGAEEAAPAEEGPSEPEVIKKKEDEDSDA